MCDYVIGKVAIKVFGPFFICIFMLCALGLFGLSGL